MTRFLQWLCPHIKAEVKSIYGYKVTRKCLCCGKEWVMDTAKLDF